MRFTDRVHGSRAVSPTRVSLRPQGKRSGISRRHGAPGRGLGQGHPRFREWFHHHRLPRFVQAYTPGGGTRLGRHCWGGSEAAQAGADIERAMRREDPDLLGDRELVIDVSRNAVTPPVSGGQPAESVVYATASQTRASSNARPVPSSSPRTGELTGLSTGSPLGWHPFSTMSSVRARATAVVGRRPVWAGRRGGDRSLESGQFRAG